MINTDPDYNALNFVPVADAIAEFQVQTAQYSAEYGRASGGQINVLTQAGTNDWHVLGWGTGGCGSEHPLDEGVPWPGTRP